MSQKRKTHREALAVAIKRQFGLGIDSTVPLSVRPILAGYVVGWKTGYRTAKRKP